MSSKELFQFIRKTAKVKEGPAGFKRDKKVNITRFGGIPFRDRTKHLDVTNTVTYRNLPDFSFIFFQQLVYVDIPSPCPM